LAFYSKLIKNVIMERGNCVVGQVERKRRYSFAVGAPFRSGEERYYKLQVTERCDQIFHTL
jgi:hypothetical protein